MTSSLSGLVSGWCQEARCVFRASPYNRDFAGNLEAAGPGFEPGLSDSELLHLPSLAFTTVSKIPCFGLILGSHVSLCSSMFVPVTVSVTVNSLVPADVASTRLSVLVLGLSLRDHSRIGSG